MNLFATLAIALGASLSTVATAKPTSWITDWKAKNPVWRGAHVILGSDSELDKLGAEIPTLSKAGLNTIIVEVDYSYQFTKRKEMAKPDGISKAGARKFAALCRQNGVRPIPQINLLGHQSWAETTDRLLTIHPELDETPGQYPNNKDIYCRSYCPQHPDLLKIVLPLIDDIADGFQADAFHVGMDEVFLIGSDYCSRCKGQDKAKLFAKAVNDLHKHIVGKKKLEMFMWSDRFLDGKGTGYGEWEASENGTFDAIDLVPKDIVMCDWHYEKRDDYPSLGIFTQKGFKVWPTTWKETDAAVAFSKQAHDMNNRLVAGTLVSTWGAVGIDKLATWSPLTETFKIWADPTK